MTARFNVRVGRGGTFAAAVPVDGPVWQVVRDWLDSLQEMADSLPEQAGADLDLALGRIEPEDVAYGLGKDGTYSVAVTIDPDLGPTDFILIDTHHAPF